MKRLMLACGFAAFFVVAVQISSVFGNGMPLSGQDSGSQLNREFSVGPGQELTFDLQTGGGISISGWDSNVVSVKATLGGRDGSKCQVDMNQTSTGVEVKSNYIGSDRNYSTNVRLEVQVPKQFNVSINSSGGGISIDNLEGTVKGTTGGGGIRISNSKGNVNLSTGGGGISVRNSALDGTVSTGGGHIVIDGNTGNLKGSTGGGKVEYKNSSGSGSGSSSDEQTGQGTGTSGSVTRVNTGGGDVHLKDVPNGAQINTGGGDITVASGRGRIHAATGGGNIEIGPVDGSIDAMTGGGHITATITDSAAGVSHNVRALTGAGDVTITLPPGISAQFDIKLAYTQNSKQNYQIISDFGIAQNTTDTWSTAEGSPRKYIYGTGTIGSGDNKIVIRNVNGNVYVRRGAQ
ncbi:MAG: hypothetical protein ACREDR_36435 [Blastocatellia bacterium]